MLIISSKRYALPIFRRGIGIAGRLQRTRLQSDAGRTLAAREDPLPRCPDRGSVRARYRDADDGHGERSRSHLLF